MDYNRIEELLQNLKELVGSGAIGGYMVPIGVVQRAYPDDESGDELNTDPKPPYSDQFFAAPNSMIRTMNSPESGQARRILVLLASNGKGKRKKK